MKDKTLLLVDDNEDDLLLMKRKFKSQDIDCNLFIVNDGEDALDYLYHKGKYSDKKKFPKPKLIILDIRMPKVGGIEVLRAVKSDDALKGIPIVMFTTSEMTEDVMDSNLLGCDHYVAKQVAFSDFENMLEPIVRHYLNL